MNIFACTLKEKKKITSDIFIITLETEKPLSYEAGQYAFLSFQAESHALQRPYSIANKSGTVFLDFHLKDSGIIEGFSHHIIHEKQIGDIIYLHRIDGDMIFDPQKKQDALFIAGGVGIAPFKAIIDAIETLGRPLQFFWGVNKKDELYLTEFLTQKEKEHPLLKTHYCVMEDADFNHFHGQAITAVEERILNLDKHDIYIAGPPSMAEHCALFLKKQGLDANNLFCDYHFDFFKRQNQ